MWDVKKREKIKQLVSPAAAAPTAQLPGVGCGVSSIAFSRGGDFLAYSHSDDWARGEERTKRDNERLQTQSNSLANFALGGDVTRLDLT